MNTGSTRNLQARRETLRADRDAMERRAGWAWTAGHADDAAYYADEAARLGEQLDEVNAELIEAGE